MKTRPDSFLAFLCTSVNIEKIIAMVEGSRKNDVIQTIVTLAHHRKHQHFQAQHQSADWLQGECRDMICTPATMQRLVSALRHLTSSAEELTTFLMQGQSIY
jgi:hypothetical protein